MKPMRSECRSTPPLRSRLHLKNIVAQHMRDIGALTQRVAALEKSRPSIIDTHQGKSLDRDEVQLMIQQVNLAIPCSRMLSFTFCSGS